jgi:hypothetical protein
MIFRNRRDERVASNSQGEGLAKYRKQNSIERYGVNIPLPDLRLRFHNARTAEHATLQGSLPDLQLRV